MIIFRMQNKNGEGCYCADGYCDVLNSHSAWNGHPTPQEDLGINRYMVFGQEICGFESIRQAVKWFRSWERRELKKEGFQIVRREVKEITARGQYQVLAIPLRFVVKQKPIQFQNQELNFCLS
jgi:hypothetical protein